MKGEDDSEEAEPLVLVPGTLVMALGETHPRCRKPAFATVTSYDKRTDKYLLAWRVPGWVPDRRSLDELSTGWCEGPDAPRWTDPSMCMKTHKASHEYKARRVACK
eukprot:221081-Rhodomonas_salina.3